MSIPVTANQFAQSCFDQDTKGFNVRFENCQRLIQKLGINTKGGREWYRHQFAACWALIEVGICTNMADATAIATKYQGNRDYFSAYWTVFHYLKDLGLNPNLATPAAVAAAKQGA